MFRPLLIAALCLLVLLPAAAADAGDVVIKINDREGVAGIPT
jgi:hypothetical protein